MNIHIEHQQRLPEELQNSGGTWPSVELVRCECQRCGSHVHAIVLKQTISGRCSTCESWDIASLGI